MPSRPARSGCSSTNGVGAAGTGCGDAAGLGAGLVLGQHPPGGEHVAGTRRRAPRPRGRCSTRHEPGPAVGGGEALGEQPRRARVRRRRRARPEDAVLVVDPVVGDAGVVGDARRRWPGAAPRRPSPGRPRTVAAPEPLGQRREDLAGRCGRRSAACQRLAAPDAPGPRGWSSCRPPRPTASTGRTTSASAAVSDRTKSQTARKSRAPSRSMTRAASGARDQRRWSRARAARGRRRRCRARRAVRTPDLPGAGQRRPGRRPRRRRRARGRPGRSMLAVAGQLVGLLPVLATALAVALTGEAAVAAARPARAGPSASARLIQAVHGVGALRVLLGARGR